MKQQADFSKVDAILPDALTALDKFKADAALPETHSATHGQKFIRIMHGGSAYAFLDADGNIYKPDGWKRPAKGVRGSIFDENFSIGKAFQCYGVAYLR